MVFGAYYMPRTTYGAQLTIENVLQSEEAIKICDLVTLKWMIDASIDLM